MSDNGGGSLEELSVPDLSSLLGNPNGNHQNIVQGQGLISQHQPHSTINSVDTHNLNLNLNVNLNSGSVITDSMNVNHSGQSQGPPPFLVFISPLRSVPVSMNRGQMNSTGTNILQQHLNQGQNSLSLNLQSIQQQPQGMDTIVTSLAGTNNLITVSSGAQHGEVIESGGGGTSDIYGSYSEMGSDLGHKLEGLTSIEGNSVNHTPTSTVMIGNQAYTVNVSKNNSNSQDTGKKDNSVITLSDLLGSSSTSSSVSASNSTLSSLILQNNTGNSGQPLASPQSSTSSSTPRLSALLAGTPSADSGINLVSTTSGVRVSLGGNRLII